MVILFSILSESLFLPTRHIGVTKNAPFVVFMAKNASKLMTSFPVFFGYIYNVNCAQAPILWLSLFNSITLRYACLGESKQNKISSKRKLISLWILSYLRGLVREVDVYGNSSLIGFYSVVLVPMWSKMAAASPEDVTEGRLSVWGVLHLSMTIKSTDGA